MQLKQSEIVELLVSLQWFLKYIDLEGTRPFSEVKEMFVQRAYQYYQLIVQHRTDGEYDVLNALELYESFHYIHCQTTWVKFGGDAYALGAASGCFVSTHLC